ncbi:hypothetical protein RN001_004941 [Aquatica leii]|uniref:DUF4097 domain-containing protein n=1 Tax=Aquatica leii TaxID=1421715 RepID=A0AAN7PBC0_9COLE|nr:hypothetical protein RN001_004941 [Aquatica leii]
MEEFLNKNNLEHLHKIFNDENIDEISLLPLLREEHIKLLIPSIGDQIKFKRALTTIINPPSNAGCISVKIKTRRLTQFNFFYYKNMNTSFFKNCFRLAQIHNWCGLHSASLNYIFHRHLYTLYKNEFDVTPFCNVNVNVPYNVKIVPLNFYLYPNCDKVIISVEGSRKLDCKINCNSNEDVVHILSNLSQDLLQISCTIEAPIKANIHALSQNGNVDIHNFHGEVINVQTTNGNITASKCVCEKIILSSSSGNITCKNVLQAAHISLSAGKNGNIHTDKLQGLNLLAKTVDGNIETQSTYCENSSFSTETGSLQLANTHKNCYVTCGENGNLNMTGFDGTLQAIIKQGNINIDVVRIEGNSKIKIENEGSLNLKLAEQCLENTSFKLFTKKLDISSDLNVVVDIKENHKIMKAGNTNVQTEIECPNSDVIIKNLSLSDMFNLEKK